MISVTAFVVQVGPGGRHEFVVYDCKCKPSSKVQCATTFWVSLHD